METLINLRFHDNNRLVKQNPLKFHLTEFISQCFSGSFLGNHPVSRGNRRSTPLPGSGQTSPSACQGIEIGTGEERIQTILVF